VVFSFTDVFHRVRLRVVPDHLARFGCNRLRFSIRGREPDRRARHWINDMVGMRVRRTFVAWLLADI